MKLVKFKHHYQTYLEGETAGFPDAEADRIVASGYADEVNSPQRKDGLRLASVAKNDAKKEPEKPQEPQGAPQTGEQGANVAPTTPDAPKAPQSTKGGKETKPKKASAKKKASPRGKK